MISTSDIVVYSEIMTFRYFDRIATAVKKIGWLWILNLDYAMQEDFVLRLSKSVSPHISSTHDFADKVEQF